MPIHDWTRVNARLFHHFHQRWIQSICDVFNTGGLPRGFYALSEQVSGGLVPDVLTLESHEEERPEPNGSVAAAVAAAPPQTRFVLKADHEIYASKANRISIRNPLGDVIAILEIVSPGNKGSRAEIRAFVSKSVELLRQGIHLLVIDPFPPTARDPRGIHPLIWDEIQEEPFELPPDKPLTLAAYSAGMPKMAYVEPVAVGDVLSSMPIFLPRDLWVPVPLEKTYMTTWELCPLPMRRAVTGSHETN